MHHHDNMYVLNVPIVIIIITKIGITGGRGIAGTVLVHKIAGATAAAGSSVDMVQSVAQTAADSCGTMGVALTTCCVPGMLMFLCFHNYPDSNMRIYRQ